MKEPTILVPSSGIMFKSLPDDYTRTVNYFITLLGPENDDWQKDFCYKMVNEFEDKTLLFSTTDSSDTKYDLDWEFSNIESADFVILYFKKGYKKSLTFIQYGMLCMTNKLFVVCDKDFFINKDILDLCIKFKIPFFYSFDGLIEYFKYIKL